MFGKLILVTLFIASLFLMAFRPAKKKKIILFGDSITEMGVWGDGYISQMDSLLTIQGQSERYELLGAGIGGNKVTDLYLRLENDVLSKQPDCVVIYIGVNDVWHKTTHLTGIDFDKFGKFYQALVAKIQAAGIKVILCTPAVIGEKIDHSNPQDGDLNAYSNWIREFSKSNELPLVDLRNLFINYNLTHNSANKEAGSLTTDRVHLNHQGNLLVAEAILQAIQKIN